MAPELRDFEFMRVRDGKVESLLRVQVGGLGAAGCWALARAAGGQHPRGGQQADCAAAAGSWPLPGSSSHAPHSLPLPHLPPQSRVIVMDPGAAGAANISCVWHRRWQQGPTMSVDLAPPNPSGSPMAGRLRDAPSYDFFRPGRPFASPEAVAGQVGARRGTHRAPSAHEAAEERAAAAAAAGVSEDAPHCYICLHPEAEQRDKLRNIEGLLLCNSCATAGSLARYSEDAAARPAVTAGEHPEFGCQGCLPGPRTKRKAGKRMARFTTGKRAKGNKKMKVARSKTDEAAAAFVAAALAQRG